MAPKRTVDVQFIAGIVREVYTPKPCVSSLPSPSYSSRLSQSPLC